MSSSESDVRFAGNMTFLAVFGPLSVMFMLAVRFFLNPLAVFLFCLVHYVVLSLLGSVMTETIGGFLGFLFLLWAYSYFLLGAFNLAMGPFESVENGVLVWAIRNLGVAGQVYYFVQRGFVLIAFGALSLIAAARGEQSGDAAFATLAVLTAIQAGVFWVYHTRHPIGVFLDFWGRPRPELMDGHDSTEEALAHLVASTTGTSGRPAAGEGWADPVVPTSLAAFDGATPLALTGRDGRRRTALVAGDGSVLLQTASGPRVFENEVRARAFIA